MTPSRQSATTLYELLGEAEECVNGADGDLAIDVTVRAKTLRYAIADGSIISAQIEHEIVSLREEARFASSHPEPYARGTNART